MTTAGKIHLYTFWNPNLCADTIEVHFRVLNRESAVKWIVLYDDQTWVAEKDKPVNLRALLYGNVIFMGVLGDEEVRRINDQVKNRHETLLYMQCLNIFQKPLYVGKVKHIKIIDRINQSDPLIPDYYFKAIEERNLRPKYSITLTRMIEARSLELRDVIPSVSFQSHKYPYPYPMMVSQRVPKIYFDDDDTLPKIDAIEIVYDQEPVSSRKCWYIKQPVSLNSEKPLTLGERELDLLKCFEGNELVWSRAKETYRSRKVKRQTTAETAIKDVAQYVRSLVSHMNEKFQFHYGRDLIKKIKTDRKRKKYSLQVNKIIITGSKSG